MVDFGKKLNKTNILKKENPIDIYNSLDRKSVTGPLRPAQESILTNWYTNYRDKNDLIIKLHTGVGKTLIGLLILQSKLNIGEGPCLYICPNIYLVNQVCSEAEKFGINYCIIGDDNELPNEFLLSKSILITHSQKVFNGKSVFGINSSYTEVGCIILDDSHACIDSINNSFSINIYKKENANLYNDILTLFEEDLIEQGEGTFHDIIASDYDSILPVPYWAWQTKKKEILKLLSENKDKKDIAFTWPLLKNYIGNCKAFVSGAKIEISPYYIPIQNFGTFHFAKNRILMSATTQNDSFFIKGLQFSIDAVKNPLTDLTQIWSGEKMILIPSLIDDTCDRDTIINYFAKEHKGNFGIVALVPSFKKAELYGRLGSNIANSSDIFERISQLKSNINSNTLVICNRYDGIDLPDEACRILIIDSIPYFESLADKYEELCRPNSEVINRKIAQKIEQGLGRSVRGEKDFSVILIIGSDLVKFIKSVNTNKYFSEQTKKQINIGVEIAELAKEDLSEDENPIKVILSLIKQSLKRDEGWKEYYSEEMNSIESEKSSLNIYDILYLENESEKAYFAGDYEKACDKVQVILDTLITNDLEKGWYLQELARYKYNLSKLESNSVQKAAFAQNPQLLKPKDGISYNKINYINENRVKRIKDFISKNDNYMELSIYIDSILDDLTFGVEAEKFELALKTVGDLLGFISQRPDKLIRKGPDNLWCVGNNNYFMFECKSEVSSDRCEISKHEAGQMNSHCGWFETEYQDAEVKRILIIPTKNLSYYANFTHEVFIMRKGKLKELKNNMKEFIKEFKNYNITDISDEKVQQFINYHKLDIESLKALYCEEYYHNTK